MLRLALERAPNEACGLLGSRGERVERVVAIANIAASPDRYFEMDPREMVNALFQFERQGLDVAAIWHSHPAGEPVPSARDIRKVSWPQVTQLIVGTGRGRPQLAAWQIRNGEVSRVPLHIGDARPAVDESHNPLPDSRLLWLCAAVAVVLFLQVAVSLLPPAPAIP